MTSPNSRSPRALRLSRQPALVVAMAAALLLSACGGSGEPAGPDALAAPQPADAGEAERRFSLWAPGGEAAIRAEQRGLSPAEDGDTVQLIVRLNPAAVFANSDRRAMLGSGGTGESGDAAALHAARLAAKANAVTATAQAVLAGSVAQAAPGAVMRQQFSHAVEGFVLTVPWAQAEAVADELARNPAVDAVEPDRVFQVGQATSGVRALDPRAWGVDRIDQRSRTFDTSFRHSRNGAGVSVYVVDTGVNAHNEFGGRLAAGYSAIADGRGTADCHGHGTHVAGTAAGVTLGVAPGARVVPVRVLNCNGSSTGSSVLQGLDWVAANGARPGVVNLSLGGPVSTTLDAATQRLLTVGFTVVTAAGNSNADACLSSPGRAAGLVNVAASDSNDAKAGFSNWGSCVALWAPGTAIASAGHLAVNAVVAMNGTSMAAPHAAGAAALLLQAQPAMAPATLRQQLLAQSTPGLVTGTPGSMSRSLLFAADDGAVPAAPAVSTVSVRSLSTTTLVPAVGSWKAVTEVLVVDEAGRPVASAQVKGRYSNTSKDIVCTTAASGACALASGVVSWTKVPVLGAAVTAVQGTRLAYTGGGERSAQIARPTAPRAQVAALTGSVLRSQPAAPDWTPQFALSLRDENGAAVANATVQVALHAHAGASVMASRTQSCRTASTGDCILKWSGSRLNATHTGAVVQVLGVQRDFLEYTPGAITRASVGRVQ